MDSIKIVFTGGPCAGKTTMIERTKEYFLNQGYNVIVVPESATNLLGMEINAKLLGSVLNFQKFIFQKQLTNEKIVDETLNLKNKLQYNKNGELYEEGYRIVYFYDDETYNIGEYCKTIEGFMIGFVDCDPMCDASDIPEFTTIDDLLDRYLDEVYDAVAVALYKTDGTCIQKNNRTTKKTGLFI